MLQNCCEVAKDVFLLRFVSPYSFPCTYTILFFFPESSDETCETWVYFLVCICTFKRNYLDLETEKYTKLFKLANLSVGVVMS